MFENLISEFEIFIVHSQFYMPFLLFGIGMIWVINILNLSSGKPLHFLGVIPRSPSRLIGIFFSPLIHADYKHLFFNSIPLFPLALFVLSHGLYIFISATIIITVVSGIGVWVFGRPGNHIGASGVIAGYFGYVLSSAYKQPSLTTIFCAAIALYYFGGILLSFIPTCEKTSWEGHLFGLLSGVAAYIFNYQYLY